MKTQPTPIDTHVVCVLGMHRSGTSLTTRILNLLGLHLGPDAELLPPLPGDNPMGFWELSAVNQLNDELLAAWGGDFWHPPELPPGWERDARVAGLRQRAVEVLEQAGMRDHSLCALKDPRLCLTLPFWQPLVRSMGYVVCVRNPVDVAASLQRRNGTAPELSHRMFIRYVSDVLRYTTDAHRLFVRYDDWFSDPGYQLDRLGAFVGLDAEVRKRAVRERVVEFIRMDLRHHRASSKELWRAEVPREVAALHEALHALAGAWPPESAASRQRQRDQVDVLRRALHDAREVLDGRDSEMRGLRKTLSNRDAQLAEARAAAEETRADLERMREALERQAATLEATTRARDAARHARRDREQRLAHAGVVLREVAHLLRRVEASRSWRYGSAFVRLLSLERLRRPSKPDAVGLARQHIEGYFRREGGGGAAVDWDGDDLGGGASEVRHGTGVEEGPELDRLAEVVRQRLGPPADLAEKPFVSIIVPTRDAGQRVTALTRALSQRTVYDRLELIVVDNASDAANTAALGTLRAPFDIWVVRNDQARSFSEACNQGAAEAQGELLLFLNDDVLPVESGWLRELVACQQRTEAAVVGARLVRGSPAPEHPSGWALQHCGIRFRVAGDGLPDPFNAGNREDALDGGNLGQDVDVPAVTAACMLIQRSTFEETGRFDTAYSYGLEDVDLCLSVLSAGGRVVCCNRAVLAHDEAATRRARPLAQRRAESLTNRRVLLERWGPRLRRELLLEADGTAPFWTPEPIALPESAREEARALSFCLKIGAPDWTSAPAWGDLGFARSLERALIGRGHAVVIQVREEWNEVEGLGCDVAIHLRGRGSYLPKGGQFNVLWSISHPAELEAWECDAFDLVCVASQGYAEQLRGRVNTPVIVLEQATDPAVFYPETDPGRRFDAVFVGSTRGVRRPVVEDLLPSRHDISVWGSGWERRLPPEVLRGERLSPEEVRRAYSAATLVLNDHWPDMRDNGYVSNRIYDALACGTMVVSDHVPGLEERFAGGVVCFRDADELRELVDRWTAQPDEARRRASRAREIVLAHHTFAHRLDVLLPEVERRRAELRHRATVR